MNASLDLLIIGAGPIGLACGIEAGRHQLNYQIIEKGCLVNSIYKYPANMTFFSTSEKIEIGGVPFVSHGPKPTRQEALEYYRRVKQLFALKVNLYESVQSLDAQGDGYLVQTSKGTYHARAVVIATGFYDQPNLLNVPGEDLPKVKHYYDEPYPYADQKIVVVGAANSAIDVALETWRKGAEVSLIHRGEVISHRVKYWVKPDIDNRIAEGSIQAYFQSSLSAIREREVDILTPDGLVTIDNDFVLAMTGYHPNFEWLTQLGIEVSDDEACFPHRNEETFESNLPNVYLAGTVCGGNRTSKWFIENSIDHAPIIVEHIRKQRALKV
jgi:thioredoxin reductase (NADPH)